MDRQDILIAIRDHQEANFWAVMAEVEKSLRDLVQVEHFDCEDATAIGAAVHSSLPSALHSIGLNEAQVSCVRYENGPSNKLIVAVPIEGVLRRVSVELHYCGPRGGTSKAKHQFAEHDVETEPELPNFHVEAPQDLLVFLSYSLTPTRTTVDKLFLMFADGIDRKKIQLHRLSVSENKMPSVAVERTGPRGTAVKARYRGKGEERDNVRAPTKRGDAAPST